MYAGTDYHQNMTIDKVYQIAIFHLASCLHYGRHTCSMLFAEFGIVLLVVYVALRSTARSLILRRREEKVVKKPTCIARNVLPRPRST